MTTKITDNQWKSIVVTDKIFSEKQVLNRTDMTCYSLKDVTSLLNSQLAYQVKRVSYNGHFYYINKNGNNISPYRATKAVNGHIIECLNTQKKKNYKYIIEELNYCDLLQCHLYKQSAIT